MRKKHIAWIVVALLVFAAGYYFYGGGSTPKGQPPLVKLSSSNMSELQNAFNNSASSIRLLVMLSPT